MNPEIILALQLLLAHVITDFVLQSEKLIIQKEEKKAKAPFLYIHAAVSGLLTYVIIQDWNMWGVAIFIAVTHFFIDLWKLYKKSDSLLILLGIWLYLTNNFNEIIPFITDFFTSKNILIIFTGYLLVIYPIGFIIGKATQRWQEEIAAEEGDFPSLKKAGRYIGIFERILVLTFILTNNFAAIGFLIAAKSILRFSDKGKSGARKQTEYVLIGTLMSFALTIIIGVLIKGLMSI